MNISEELEKHKGQLVVIEEQHAHTIERLKELEKQHAEISGVVKFLESSEGNT